MHQAPPPRRRRRPPLRMMLYPPVLQRWFRNDWKRLIVFPVLIAVIVLSVFIEGSLATAIMIVALGILLFGLAVVIGPWQGSRRLIDTMPAPREDDSRRRR